LEPLKPWRSPVDLRSYLHALSHDYQRDTAANPRTVRKNFPT
jgi:hypothetical protein